MWLRAALFVRWLVSCVVEGCSVRWLVSCVVEGCSVCWVVGELCG